jgi:hypothetical protein
MLDARKRLCWAGLLAIPDLSRREPRETDNG